MSWTRFDLTAREGVADEISESCRAGSHRGGGDHGRGRNRCGRNRAATSPPTSDPTVTEVVAPEGSAGSTLPATETVAADTDWEKVVPGGDCACADGSEFNFWVREADSAKVVLFLDGGGACFDPTTCAFAETRRPTTGTSRRTTTRR